MDMQMAERLVARRKAAGYSQEALAAELGVSRQAVSKWEHGEASPDTDNLIALAGLYGVTLDELLFGEASPDPKDAGEKNENPAKSQVRISLREGIHVVDPKGEEVHVGWDGIHVSDAEGNTVESDPEGEGVTINGTHYKSWHDAHEELGHLAALGARVEVLNAQDQRSAHAAHGQPRHQGREDVAQVHASGRRGGKAPAHGAAGCDFRHLELLAIDIKIDSRLHRRGFRHQARKT